MKQHRVQIGNRRIEIFVFNNGAVAAIGHNADGTRVGKAYEAASDDSHKTKLKNDIDTFVSEAATTETDQTDAWIDENA